MINKISIFILGCCCFILSCQSNPYKKYTQTLSGLKYHLIKFGNSNRKVQANDYITCNLTIISQDKDTLFASKKPFTFQLKNLIGSNEAFSLLSQGDSASFITTSGKFRKNSTGINLKTPVNNVPLMVNIHIIRIRTPKEHQAEAPFLKKDPAMKEQAILKAFLTSNQISQQFYKDGVYFLPMTKGYGKKTVKKGTIVTLKYRGYFIDGKEFDNTKYNKNKFQITYGKPGQIIKGLMIGIKGMKIGEKAKIIIPSQLGFGSRGTINNIVPPYTSIIYEVTILNIKNENN